MRRVRQVFALVAAAIGLAETRRLQLLQIQVVTRHGARTILTKDEKTLAEGGSCLTLEGETQHRDLGAEIRQWYFMNSSSGNEDLIEGMEVYKAEDVWAVSSSYDRTIASSMSLNHGLWPWPHESRNPLLSPMVPVHTIDQDDDITIRAYSNCPTFKQSLQTLYTSKRFEAKTREHMNLLNTLTLYFPDLTTRRGEVNVAQAERTRLAEKEYSFTEEHVPLSRVWNAFDAANVARHGKRTIDQQGDSSSNSGSSRGGGAIPDLPDELFTELAALAAWVEHERYGTDVAVGPPPPFYSFVLTRRPFPLTYLLF
jgi:hypothetical protein